MIQANELRIGNYLNYKDTDYLAKVQLINSINHFDCRDEFGAFTPNGKYQPIPLTNEWLMNLGFEYDLVFYTKGLLNLCPNRNGNYTPYIHTLTHGRVELDVKFVHQLQNLYFSLTNSELVLSNVPEATKPAL